MKKLFCIVMVPISIACYMFRLDFVSIVYERGNFSAESTHIVSGVFACKADLTEDTYPKDVHDS